MCFIRAIALLAIRNFVMFFCIQENLGEDASESQKKRKGTRTSPVLAYVWLIQLHAMLLQMREQMQWMDHPQHLTSAYASEQISSKV